MIVRIIYLHQYFNTPAMSGGTRSFEMARRLVAAGHEVQMVTSWREADGRRGWFETEEDGIRVHWFPVAYSNHMGYVQRVAAFAAFAFAAGRRAAKLQGDVVFATSTPLTIALPGRYAAKKLGVPMVFEVRDLWPELPIAIGALTNPILKFLAFRLEKYAYRHSSQIVALSDGMAEGVRSTGYPADRVSVIPNSADLAHFNQGGDGEVFRERIPNLASKPLVSYTGTLGAINGVGYLVDIAAAARVLAPELHFAIVGDGKECASVRQRAEECGVLNKNFFMFPPVPKSDMPKVLAASQVATSLFVDLEPMWMNSANKFFDALASGTPIAINYGGWQDDVLRESGAGIRLPANDAVKAACMLRDWVGDSASLADAGLAARRLAEDRYDRDLLAVRLEGVLLKAIENQSRIRPNH